MQLLQVGATGSVLLFVVVPAVTLAAAIALSSYEVYRIGERKLLIITVILALMLQHQLLEAQTFWQTGEPVGEGFGEVFETSANVIASGSVYYVLRFARRERRLVRDLERSERQYRALIEGSPVSILLHGADGIRYANDRALELFGAEDQAELTGRELATFLPGDGATAARETVLGDGESDAIESQLRTLDGQVRDVVMTGVPAEYEGADSRQVVVRDITERKRREREYEHIFNNVHDPITIHDPETGKLLEVNDAFCETIGYDREAILAMGIEGYSPTDAGYTRERAREFVREVVETGEQKRTEWEVETADGETRWLVVRGTTVQIGGDYRYISINRDVTERRRREREYEQIFNSVTNGITVFHPDTGEILDVNDTYHEMVGYDDLERLRQLGIDGLSVTEEGYTGQRGRELIREVAETGETRTVEWRGERKEGTRLWLEATLTPAEIGGERRVISIQRDVTERKRREREYEQIFNSVNDGIVVWDPETLAILDANDAYLEMLGYDDLEALRQRGVDGLSVTEEGYTHERGLEIHQRVVETGEPELIEWRGETSDGKRIWLEVKVAPAVIGGQQRTISINRDITERRRREQRLEVFNRILRHNLRNQLEVIRSHAEVLAVRTDGDHADEISAAADRLAALGERAREIDQFMSRERRATTVDVSELVRETLDAVDPASHGVEVAVDLPENASVVTDSEVLTAVLEPALDNAIQYAASTVSVTGERSANQVRILIEDDGPGIPAAELTPLDAGTETALEHGRGLGLWQLKWGVTKLDGDLSFDTDDGTTVGITLPDLEAVDPG